MPSLTSTIPGFSSLNSGSSDLIRQLMSGQLSTGARKSIYDAGAERGVMNGMPGSSTSAGSLFANADLRNIGRASADQQQLGFQDFLALLGGYSGTVAPSASQELQLGQQQNQFDQNLGFQKSEADRANVLANQEQNYRYRPQKITSIDQYNPNGVLGQPGKKYSRYTLFRDPNGGRFGSVTS